METEQVVIGAVFILIIAAVAFSVLAGVPLVDNPTAKCQMEKGCWISNIYAYPTQAMAVDSNGTSLGMLRTLETVCIPNNGKMINNYTGKTILNCTNAVLVQ